MKFRLQTKLLFFLLLVSVGLTTASLTVARQVVEKQAREQVLQDLQNSLQTFRNTQRQREATLSRSAQLVANLPLVRALMTTQHSATIQDGSRDLWHLAGCDLLLLGAPDGKLMALHASASDLNRAETEQVLARSIQDEATTHWWLLGTHLYQVSVQPVYFGSEAENRVVGYLAAGAEIDDNVAREISQVATSQVAFRYAHVLVRSTLTPAQEAELRETKLDSGVRESFPYEIKLGGERFLETSVDLSADGTPAAQLTVLKSVDKATAFITNLYRSLMALGVVTVCLGALLVYWISRAFTRPLENLVGGVRALEKGDYTYPLQPTTSDELAELTVSFAKMRTSLQETQRELLEAERLATIGRMASSISHDLRHSLAAVLANSEFLSSGGRSVTEREELYQEIRIGVNQMTDLIDSLLEFSRNRETLRLAYGSLSVAAEHAIHAVRMRPEYHDVNIELSVEGKADGYFDARRLERVFQNLLLNACEALPPRNGKIDLKIREVENGLEILIADNGHGIPEAIRDRIFEPFVSHGKENGTGLGLTVVQKIVTDHGGEVRLESSSSRGTAFFIYLPQLSPVRAVSQESFIVRLPI